MKDNRILPLWFVCILLFMLMLNVNMNATAQAQTPAPDAEFAFSRAYYTSGNPVTDGYGQGRTQTWLTDWPEAESHFIEGLSRLTRVNTSAEGRVVSLLEDDFYDYPWMYAVEVGYWNLSDLEAKRLREYLLRGGFLMVDDFHGTQEWAGFMTSMRKIFPDRQFIEIDPDHEVMHVLFDLNNKVQIHGLQFFYSGRTYEKDGIAPHWRGIMDDAGRLMVAINFNMDIGDAWEHADTPYYPEPMTALAYRFGTNYVIYAMTH